MKKGLKARNRTTKSRSSKKQVSDMPAEHSDREFSNARDLFRSGDFQGAMRALKNLIRKERGNFEALVLLASCYSFLGDYEEAVKCHETAVEADPSDAQRWHNLASDLLNLGDLDKAERAVKEAIRLDGRRGSSHYHLARIIARRGDSEKALSVLKKALELQPELRDSMTEQPDFAPLSDDDRFKQLVTPKKDTSDYPFFERGEA